MSDPMDQPEDDAYDLAVPFVVCQSQGFPVMRSEVSDEVPEWSLVTFRVSAEP